MIATLLSRAYGHAPLMLCLATLGWGGNTIASRLAVGEVSPMMLIFLRWGVVVAIILTLYRKEMLETLPIMRKRWLWVALMGGLGLSMFNSLFYIAGHYTTAVNLGIIQSTMPALILMGSFLVFKTRINLRQCVGLLIALLGVVAVISQGSWQKLAVLTFNMGDVLMLIACLFYSGYTLGLRGRPNVSSMVMMGFFAIFAWLATIPMLAIEAYTTGIIFPGVNGWLIIAYVAIMPSFLSQVFFMRGVDLIGPGAAGLYTNMVPVFAAILAVLLLNESFHLFHLTALILVFAGIYLFEIKK